MSQFRDSLYGEGFSVSAELNPATAISSRSLREQASCLAPVVDGVHVSDDPREGVHFPALSAAALLLEAGVDPILQISCRDKTLSTLEIELRGALSLGVHSFLMVRGEYGGLSGSSDRQVKTSTTQLIELASRVDRLERAGQLAVGTIATVFRPAQDWRADALRRKADAGATFVRTQLCFDVDLLRDYTGRLVQHQITWQAPLIVGVAVLPSARGARWLIERSRGSAMPDTIVRRLDQAADAEAEGVRIAAETIAAVREIPGVAGVSVMTPGDTALVAEAVGASGVRSS